MEIRRLRFELLILILNNLACINSCDRFSVSTPSSVNTRSSGARLVSSIGRTFIISNNFFSRHINLWNTLSSDIKLAPSLSTFKRKLSLFDHSFLIAIYIYIYIYIYLYIYILRNQVLVYQIYLSK